ncbi:MAG: electron transfer flavoprotein subunit alpha/FixB family protein [Rhodothermia bacterium]|nr:electron transfer flavoprotein subunit alpha/FixB family protein [Rhodothermia bacterium]
MARVLCVAAVQDGRIKRSSLEVLTHFRQLCDRSGGAVEAVVLDPQPNQFVDTLQKYGASRIFLVAGDAFGQHLNEPVVRALESVFRQSGADAIAFASTESAKDVLGALSVRLGAAVLSDVADVDVRDGDWVATRPVMAAKRHARTKALTTPVIVSVRAGSYVASEAPAEADVVEVSFSDDEQARRPEIREVLVALGGTVDLSEATVVVAAGRGVKDNEGRQLIEELAEVFKAPIGATRAVVESGMYPATSQIGQTGKVVSPDLYFAIGISGAIQHVAGMVNSRVIVAINKDPDAPIFQYCTYGLVGDLYKILPSLTEELRAAVAG